MDLSADVLDNIDLIWLIFKMPVKALPLTVTVKAKPDANPYKQIPGNKYEKPFNVEKAKIDD